MRMTQFFSAFSLSTRLASIFAFVAMLSAVAASSAHAEESFGERNYKERGYFNCVVTQERRAVINDVPAKEICVLSIECEAPGKPGVQTSAVCKPLARNNRCPEARDCLTDDSITDADYAKKSGEYVARDSKDACYQPSQSVSKVAAALRERDGKAAASAAKPATAPSSRAPSAN